MKLAPLLLAYDHEDPGFRRWVEWIQARDREGRIVSFPLHNPELARMAPELGGYPLESSPHGLDTRQRAVLTYGPLLQAVLLRLPGWRWLGELSWVPLIRGLAWRLLGPGARQRQGRGYWRD